MASSKRIEQFMTRTIPGLILDGFIGSPFFRRSMRQTYDHLRDASQRTQDPHTREVLSDAADQWRRIHDLPDDKPEV